MISCVTGRRDNPYTIGPNCGSRIWTYDLRVMSPTSYLAAPSRVNYKEDVGFEPTHAFTRLTVFKTVPFSQTWVILHKNIVRTGFEPVLPPWKGGVLTPWPTDHINKTFKVYWGSWIRTNAWGSQSPLPYRLAIPHKQHKIFYRNFTRLSIVFCNFFSRLWKVPCRFTFPKSAQEIFYHKGYYLKIPFSIFLNFFQKNYFRFKIHSEMTS